MKRNQLILLTICLFVEVCRPEVKNMNGDLRWIINLLCLYIHPLVCERVENLTGYSEGIILPNYIQSTGRGRYCNSE